MSTPPPQEHVEHVFFAKNNSSTFLGDNDLLLFVTFHF